MSYPDTDRIPGQNPQPIPVVVRGLPPVPPPLRSNKTVAQVYVIDGSNSDNSKRQVQIAAFEPTRRRIAIHSYDAAVNVVFNEPPRTSPDTSAVGVGPAQGVTVPGNDSCPPWEFYGTDAVWLNAANTTPTRVAVIKEYE